MISKAGATSQDFCGNYWRELISCGENYFHPLAPICQPAAFAGEI
jgi:hypothetical protein